MSFTSLNNKAYRCKPRWGEGNGVRPSLCNRKVVPLTGKLARMSVLYVLEP